jgi:hypothetical protein
VAVACVAKLVRTVLNAWMLTFGLLHTEAAGQG